MKMMSPTYGKCDENQVISIIENYIRSNWKNSDGFNIVIGTDSQNFSDTKVVVVIAVQNVGHGGIFFYDVSRIERINNIRQKLMYETNMSLFYANKMITKLENSSLMQEKNADKINFCVHIDAGTKGKTSGLIPELVAWVKACGYDCQVKPDSFAASSIADKISK